MIYYIYMLSVTCPLLTTERYAIKDACSFHAICFQSTKLAKLIITIQKSISTLYVMKNSHTTGNKSYYGHEQPSIKWRLIMRKTCKSFRDVHHLSLLCWTENVLNASMCNRHVNMIFKLLHLLNYSYARWPYFFLSNKVQRFSHSTRFTFGKALG